MNLTKLLRLDLNYFIKNGFWVYNAYIISIISGLILTFFYGNFLSKEVFGKFTFILSVLSLVTFFSLPGMNQALTQSFFKLKFGNYTKVISQTIRISIIGSAIISGLGIYYLNKDSDISKALFLISFLFPFISISTYYQSFIISSKNFRKLSIINIINYILTSVFTIIAVIFKFNLLLLVLSSLLPSLLLNLFFTFLYLFQTNQKNIDNTYIKMGYHISIAQYLHFLTKSIDKLLIGILIPFSNLAIYAIALVIPEQINNFTRQIIPLLIPKIAELKEKNIRKDLINKFYQLELIIFIGIIFYFLISDNLFNLLFPQYRESVALSQIYAITLISLPTNILNLVFQRRKMNKLFYIQESSLLIILLISLLITLPIYGISGAIYSQVTSRMVYTLITILLFKKYIT